MRTSTAALVLLLLAAGVVASRSYWFEHQNFVRSSRGPSLHSPLMAAGRDAAIPVPGGSALAAWFVPPRNHAIVVLLHGTSSDRRSLLPEARILTSAGFGVLAFDWPGYGSSPGDVDWGAGGRRALAAAVDWVASAPAVDPTRIGAFGFSNGGYILAQVAANDVRLRSIVLAATPTNLEDQVRWEYRRYGPLSQWPALWALHSAGHRSNADTPIDLVPRMAPRPVLIIGGTADPTVPPSMVRALFRTARDPKELWMVPGAAHGQYASIAPDAYRRKLVAFFSDTLLDAGAHRVQHTQGR